jgi:hypothetical protein
MKRPSLSFGLALGILLVSPSRAADTNVLNSDLARRSYAYGMNIGYSLVQNAGTNFDHEILLRGMSDVLRSNQLLLTPQEVREVLAPALKEATTKAEEISCINNLKQIGLAFMLWASDHDDQFPFNVKTNAGGTLELCARDERGFEADATPHFLVMTNELFSPKILVCPADPARQPATNWASVTASNVTYRVRTGLSVTRSRPGEVLTLCPIHQSVGKADGSVDAPARSSGSPMNRWLSEDRVRWCAEAQAAVESWLRADTNNWFTPKYGKFVSLKGSGYVWPPAWNIQGYDYMTLHRTGHFADGTLPVTIYVTEGAITAPGQTNLGIPVLDGPVTAQGARIFISHPKVGKGVKDQPQPETNAVRPSQTALLSLDDKIKRQQFDQAVQRWGDEGMTAVESFLKTGTNEINSVCGDFVGFEDDGTAHYQFITTKEVSQFGGHSFLIVYNARALFSGGYILLNIYITEGRALSPRLVGIGTPTIQGSLNLRATTAVVVPHPDLCSLEDFQAQDSLAYLATDGETKLVGKYKLRSSHSASNEPCTLEMRSDHSLIVSNCPMPGDPQRRVNIPGEWSLSAHCGRGIFFQLSVSGGGDVKLRSATCNLIYPPSPSGFHPMIRLTLQSASGATQDLEFAAEKALPSPFMPRPNPHFISRKPTGNPPNWDKPIVNNPETQLREAINSRLKIHGTNDTGLAMPRMRLAELLYRQGALTEAETQAREGLAGLRKQYGNQTIYVPDALHTLSRILQAQGRLPEAESALREELAIKQKNWPGQTFRVTETVSNLNQVLKLQGKPLE